MNHETDWRPLLRWDGSHLVTGLDAVNRIIARVVDEQARVESVVLSGGGDRIRVVAVVPVAGLLAQVALDLREIRLRHGYLGFRIVRLAVLGGLRLPRAIVEEALERALPDGLLVYRKRGVVVLNLDRWLPSELDLRIVAVQIIGDALHLWVGPGALASIPAAAAPRLAAGEPSP